MTGRALDSGMPNQDAYRLGHIAASAGHPGRKDVGDSIDRGLILAHLLKIHGYEIRPIEGGFASLQKDQLAVPLLDTWPGVAAYIAIRDPDGRAALIAKGWTPPAPKSEGGHD